MGPHQSERSHSLGPASLLLHLDRGTGAARGPTILRVLGLLIAHREGGWDPFTFESLHFFLSPVMLVSGFTAAAA